MLFRSMLDLLSMISVARVGQVHLFFRARMLDTVLEPGPETIEARLFHEHQIPWDEIAFGTVRDTLKHYFECRKRDEFSLYCGSL